MVEFSKATVVWVNLAVVGKVVRLEEAITEEVLAVVAVLCVLGLAVVVRNCVVVLTVEAVVRTKGLCVVVLEKSFVVLDVVDVVVTGLVLRYLTVEGVGRKVGWADVVVRAVAGLAVVGEVVERIIML